MENWSRERGAFGNRWEMLASSQSSSVLPNEQSMLQPILPPFQVAFRTVSFEMRENTFLIPQWNKAVFEMPGVDSFFPSTWLEEQDFFCKQIIQLW